MWSSRKKKTARSYNVIMVRELCTKHQMFNEAYDLGQRRSRFGDADNPEGMEQWLIQWVSRPNDDPLWVDKIQVQGQEEEDEEEDNDDNDGGYRTRRQNQRPKRRRNPTRKFGFLPKPDEEDRLDILNDNGDNEDNHENEEEEFVPPFDHRFHDDDVEMEYDEARSTRNPSFTSAAGSSPKRRRSKRKRKRRTPDMPITVTGSAAAASQETPRRQTKKRRRLCVTQLLQSQYVDCIDLCSSSEDEGNNETVSTVEQQEQDETEEDYHQKDEHHGAMEEISPSFDSVTRQTVSTGKFYRMTFADDEDVDNDNNCILDAMEVQQQRSDALLEKPLESADDLSLDDEDFFVHGGHDDASVALNDMYRAEEPTQEERTNREQQKNSLERQPESQSILLQYIKPRKALTIKNWSTMAEKITISADHPVLVGLGDCDDLSQCSQEYEQEKSGEQLDDSEGSDCDNEAFNVDKGTKEETTVINLCDSDRDDDIPPIGVGAKATGCPLSQLKRFKREMPEHRAMLENRRKQAAKTQKPTTTSLKPVELPGEATPRRTVLETASQLSTLSWKDGQKPSETTTSEKPAAETAKHINSVTAATATTAAATATASTAGWKLVSQPAVRRVAAKSVVSSERPFEPYGTLPRKRNNMQSNPNKSATPSNNHRSVSSSGGVGERRKQSLAASKCTKKKKSNGFIIQGIERKTPQQRTQEKLAGVVRKSRNWHKQGKPYKARTFLNIMNMDIKRWEEK